MRPNACPLSPVCFQDRFNSAHHTPVDIRCFDYGEQLLAAIEVGEAFDILFLDIYMGEKDGIAVAQRI